MKYSERVSQIVTQARGESSIGVASSARQQDRTASRPFAVFDIDGTLIRWQLYHAVVDKLAKKGLLGDIAHSKLHNARMVWKRREHSNAFHDYETNLIHIYESALPTLSTKDFDYYVDEVAKKYKAQVYTFTRDLARKLKKSGYVLIAISGSHEELVRHIAQQYSFDIWVGSKYKRKGNNFTGEKEIASFDKKTVLQKIVKENGLTYLNSYGVGDSKSDAPMLNVVDNPIAFNPDRELIHIAKSKNWKIVIERKNVVYNLEASENGKYFLV